MGPAGLGWPTCRRGDRAEETEVASARREKERKEMTGGVAVSVGANARAVTGRAGEEGGAGHVS